MLIITAATIAVFVLTYVYMRSHKSDFARLVEQRTPLATMGVQIICGDCSGEDEIPIKTYLNRAGSCDRCGGESYILASDVGLHALQMRAAQMASRRNGEDGGRVLPFETPAARASRSDKIAV